MIEDDRPLIVGAGRSHWRWTRIFLLLTGLLSATILLKFAQIQYLELIFALQLFLLLCLFVKQGLKVRLLRSSLTVGVLYFVFMVAAFVLALVALRNQFFYSADLNLLKRPVWITISRTVELAIDAGIMIYLVEAFRRNRAALVFTIKVYLWTGVASAFYSFLSYPLSVLHIPQWGIYHQFRLRGFYNEGGPYGLYLLSVLVVGVALYKLNWVRRSHLRVALLLLFAALIGSQSKAAVSALIVIMIANTLMVRGVQARLVVLAIFIAGVFVLSVSVDLPGQLRLYRRNAAIYERLSNIRYNDGNFIYGRVAGAFIVPRMITAHPLTGVGWGNYGLVRNNPVYRGASTWVNGDDVSGLGLFGEGAELGIPLALFLLLCLTFPYFYLRHIHAPFYVQNLALIQPIVHIFGGQLNLTYPWVVTAFALALGGLAIQSTPQTHASAAPVLNGSSVLT